MKTAIASLALLFFVFPGFSDDANTNQIQTVAIKLRADIRRKGEEIRIKLGSQHLLSSNSFFSTPGPIIGDYPGNLEKIKKWILEEYGRDAIVEWKPIERKPTKKSIAWGLMTTDSESRKQVFNNILNGNHSTIERIYIKLDLIQMVETQWHKADRSYEGTLHLAIVLLGKLKAKEAVASLSTRLMFVPTGSPVSETNRVCAVALSQIGERAVPAVLKTLCKSGDSEERDVAAWVVYNVDDQGKGMARKAIDRLNLLIDKHDECEERYKFAKEFLIKTSLPKN